MSRPRSAEALRRLAEAARQEADYLRGVADALTWASDDTHATAGRASPAGSASSSPRGDPYRGETRVPTQTPILEMLRRSGDAMSVSELVDAAKSEGHDLLRQTVRQVLERALERGLVERRNYRYRIGGRGESDQESSQRPVMPWARREIAQTSDDR